ncbi:MAG: hypothetical protein ACYDAG_13500 [Chloroflexota bacterium]
MKSSRWAGALALACLLAAPGAALAQTTPAAAAAGPTPLLSTTGGTVPGGGEADYSLAYPGGSLTAKVSLQYSPPDTSDQVSFQLVGSQGVIQPSLNTADGACIQNDNGTVIPNPDCTNGNTNARQGNNNVNVLSAEFTQASPETYLIKVFNHKGGVPLTYTLSVSGIPLPCQPATTPGGADPQSASSLGQPVTSQLAGDPSQGRFTYYRFHYAGDGSNLMLVLSYNPSGPTSGNAVGFNVYLGTDAVAKGAPTASAGQVVSGYQSQTAGDYYVQLYNYTDTTINYTLSLSGLPCLQAQPAAGATPTPTPAVDGKTSDAPVPLAASDQRQLGGNASGSFVWYRFVYDGHSQPNISMSFSPSDPRQSSGSGFNLYGPGNIWVQAGLNGQGPGNISATIPSYGQPGAYYVQVYNYLPGSTISYTIQR